MPSQPKPRPVGRPKLPKGHAKSGVIQVRLSPDTRKRLDEAAKMKGQTVSELIRTTLEASSMDKQKAQLRVLNVDRSETAVIVDFSDNTTASFSAEELAAMRPNHEVVAARDLTGDALMRSK